MRVGFFATLRPIVGAPAVDLDVPEGATVKDLVDLVVARWPGLAEALLDETGALSRKVHVFVNGRSAVYLDAGLATPLEEGTKVDFAPAVAGGRAR